MVLQYNVALAKILIWKICHGAFLSSVSMHQNISSSLMVLFWLIECRTSESYNAQYSSE